MAKDPWQVPDHDNSQYKPSQAWKRAVESPRAPAPMEQPKFMRLLVFLVGMALLLFGLSLAIPLSGGLDPYLARGVIIAVIFGGAAAFWSRASLWKIAKVAGLWAVIISGISVFYLYRSDFAARFMTSLDPAGVTSTDEGLVVRRARDGHFWLRARINGVPLLMMVDTGASNVVLSPEDAAKAGFSASNLTFDRVAQTANGEVKFAGATAGRFSIGAATFFDVPITVNGADMSGSLLGMSVLDRFASIEFRGNSMILRE